MEDCKENPKQPEARVTSEIKQFQALGAWCTPEFLIQASQSVQSRVRVGGETAGPTSTMTGRYLAARTPLAGPNQINKVLDEMKSLLRSARGEIDSANRNELLQMWMSVERYLDEEEHQRLFPAILDRLFPGNKAPHNLREEKTAQKGGY
jgi:hypothetical protein